MLPWKLQKRQILTVNQNLLSVYFSLAKFQLVSCNLSLAMIWQMTYSPYTFKLPKLCSATLRRKSFLINPLNSHSSLGCIEPSCNSSIARSIPTANSTGYVLLSVNLVVILTGRLLDPAFSEAVTKRRNSNSYRHINLQFRCSMSRSMTNSTEYGNVTSAPEVLTSWNAYSTSVAILAGINIFLAITASLCNTLILTALHKVTSIYPPTKLLFQCLAVTDLLVGLISQPFYVTFLFLCFR